MKKPERRVIWTHPKGRFVLIEVNGVNVFGQPFCYRTTKLTPTRRTDCARFFPQQMELEVFKPAAKKLDEGEKKQIVRLYRKAMSIGRIARVLGRSAAAVRDCLIKEGLL